VSQPSLKLRLQNGPDEHTENLVRLRKGAGAALVAWPLFSLVDIFICTFVAPGRLWLYLAIRAIGMIPLAFAFFRLRSPHPPGRTELRVIDAWLVGTLTALATIPCVEFGGIASPLVMGALIILVARSTVIADHWKRALWPVGAIALVHPLTLLGMAAVMPGMAAQLSDPTLLAQFALNQSFLLCAAGMVLFGGHMTYTLKRKVFEARSLGHYKLLKKIGGGAMGEVWAAHHQSLKRDVAVKILRPEKQCTENIARFEREVRATAELSHPNTVRVFDYGATDDGLWYYAMELLEGMDLRDLVHAEGPMTEARATRLVWQASRALAEAHRRGIIHRDLKPENLFVTSVRGEGDFIKVLDFGLATLVASRGGSDLTNDGFAVGTPKYVSPEVLYGEPADARSDVYALGAVLYFLLTGVAPFDYDDPQRNFIAHMNEEPVPPSQRGGRRLTPALEALIMRCLRKTPELRYVDASELATALEDAAMASKHIPTRPVVLHPRVTYVTPYAVEFDSLDLTMPDHSLPVFE